MSVKKWQQLAKEKSAIDQQTEEIHQKFKMDKINKEFGQLSGEEFLNQLQKGLMKRAATMKKKKKKKKRSRKVLITQWMNLTKITFLVMNSVRMHQHQPHHHHQNHHHYHHHPHIKKLLMMMMIFHHHHPNR